MRLTHLRRLKHPCRLETNRKCSELNPVEAIGDLWIGPLWGIPLFLDGRWINVFVLIW
jgi:hypothetical protein